MKKIRLFCLSVMTAVSVMSAWAGGLLTNTNQSIEFLRNPARDAAIGIDGVYSNPAGVVFLGDGIHLSLNLQNAPTRLVLLRLVSPSLSITLIPTVRLSTSLRAMPMPLWCRRFMWHTTRASGAISLTSPSPVAVASVSSPMVLVHSSR